ncbi:hypothetical protein [Robiginitalea sp. SC105]|uniref:hypothetical protein n=1 Tax=Robiginitalea sp. SC105 TaxID=2762332 RepID=UPI001C8D76D3|nr:hypothetical protein [Robiginitalea sp. SC105]
MALTISPVVSSQEVPRVAFDQDKDLLLANFDCKTDIDDLHSVAAMATLLRHPNFNGVHAYAVAGAYGVQEGLYVPPNPLFDVAFGDQWSDAHADFGRALLEVYIQAKETLDAGGDIWIPEAGQSDFSAALLRQIRERNPDLDTRNRIHIVQHSDWNEEVTSQESLSYVKQFADYIKIPDGNAVDNGSPGFRSDEAIPLGNYLKDPELEGIWELAIELGHRYNGMDGRYLNTSVQAGGLDFSDLSETCYILGIEGIRDGLDFFRTYGQ